MSGFLRKRFGKQQAPQSTDEESDLEKFYTDSEHARQVFEQLATSANLPSTTLLVSSRTEGLDLVGLNEPEDEILEEPVQHLAMHRRQGTPCD